MPLGTKAGLGPGHIVLHGDPARPRSGTAPPQFLAHIYCGHGRPYQLLLSCCLFYEISQEPLNGSAPNSRGRRVWSLTRTSLKGKVTRDKKTLFLAVFGGLHAVCLVKHLSPLVCPSLSIPRLFPQQSH